LALGGLLSHDTPAVRWTPDAGFLGTPAFFSPQQARGRAAKSAQNRPARKIALPQFRQIKLDDRPRLNRGLMAHSGLFRTTQRNLFRARRPPARMETLMKKTLTALLAAATIAVSLAGTATDASAQRGGAFAAGLVGGLVGGAIIGSAVANSRPAYVAPAPGYVVYPGYAAAVPAPGCYWTRMPVYDAYGNQVGWHGRPVVVCP